MRSGQVSTRLTACEEYCVLESSQNLILFTFDLHRVRSARSPLEVRVLINIYLLTYTTCTIIHTGTGIGTWNLEALEVQRIASEQSHLPRNHAPRRDDAVRCGREIVPDSVVQNLEVIARHRSVHMVLRVPVHCEKPEVSRCVSGEREHRERERERERALPH